METRCKDDLVCNFADEAACSATDGLGIADGELVPSAVACSVPPTIDDNDAGTN